MNVQLLSYQPLAGWDRPLPTAADSDRTLVLVFGPSRLTTATSRALNDLLARFPKSAVLGCSTAGEILGNRVLDGSLTVALIEFERTRLREATARVPGVASSRAAGRAVAAQLAGHDLQAILLLSDGIHVNGSDLVQGLNETLPSNVIVTGGLAADDDRFERTWVIADDRPSERVVTAVGIYGDAVRIRHGCRGGWDVFGIERTVTRSVGNVLFELDGYPALALYKQYLGDLAAELPGSALLFPLSVRLGGGESVVRTILGIDERAQSLRFAGDIPLGTSVTLMKANFDRLVDAAGEAGADASGRPDPLGDNVLAMAVSCVGRRLVLRERAEDELDAAREAMPPTTSLLGFYSYGEIAPSGARNCDLHNQTLTLTTIEEAA